MRVGWRFVPHATRSRSNPRISHCLFLMGRAGTWQMCRAEGGPGTPMLEKELPGLAVMGGYALV